MRTYHAQLTRTCLAGSVALMAFATSATAQSTNEPAKLKPVVVTGSLIPTAETVGATPVDIVSVERLERAGIKSPEQIAKLLPSAIGAGNFGSSRGNGGDGSSAIALRGIPGGTLVLMNGRRLTPNSFNDGSTVDLNTIPLAAVEQIEILKDGGSAIYGADAVAGVVNFIMKKNFNGTAVSAYYGNTTEKDAASQTYSFITGSSDEKTSFLVGGSYYEQNALYSKDRDRSRADISNTSNTSGTSNPGRFNIRNDSLGGVGGGQLYDPTAAPDAIVGVRVNENAVANAQGQYAPSDYRLFNNNDRFPFPNFTPAIRPAERYYFFANAEHQLIGDSVKFFAEGSYAYTWTYNQLAPTPFNSAFSPATIGSNNFYNPWDTDISSWSYRTVELGPRSETISGDTFRIVTGLRGDIPDTTLKWETAFLYGRDRRQQILGGDFSYNAVLQTMDRNTADAFNPFGSQSLSPALLTEIGEPLYTVSDQQLGSVDLSLHGELFDLWAGPVGFAAGGQYSEEQLDYQPDYPQRSGDLVGFNQDAPLNAKRYVSSLFAEISIPLVSPDQEVPLLHNFEFNAALRYDDYDDFGDTTNPKLSFRWQPFDKTLTLRGSYSTSFRAPTFTDLYTQPSEDFPELRNPVIFATNSSSPFAFTQIRTLRQGNPDLVAETAKNFTAGFVWSPKFIKNFTMSLDWYHIDQENVPAGVDQFILDQNYAGGGPFDPNAPFASLIVADGNSPEIYQLLYSPTLNLSQRIIEGVDLSLRYDIPTDKFGTFALGLEGAYVYKFEQENIPGEGLHDRLGDFIDESQGFGLGTIPRFKGNASAFWSLSGFEFGLTFNYIHSYQDDAAAIGYEREVDSILTLDLQASYSIMDTGCDWINNTKFTVGCINVTDEEPPLVVAAFADNYDRDTHDLRGRFIYVSLSKTF